MKDMIMVLCVVLGAPMGAWAANVGQPASLPQNFGRLAVGVQGIQRAVGEGDFSQASSRLGGLYENGSGGFESSSDAVYAGEGGSSKYVGAYSAGGSGDRVLVVPPPKVAAARGDDTRGVWDGALAALAGLGGLLMLARQEPADPDVLADKREDNKTQDPEVQKGIDRTQQERQQAQEQHYEANQPHLTDPTTGYFDEMVSGTTPHVPHP